MEKVISREHSFTFEHWSLSYVSEISTGSIIGGKEQSERNKKQEKQCLIGSWSVEQIINQQFETGELCEISENSEFCVHKVLIGYEIFR